MVHHASAENMISFITYGKLGISGNLLLSEIKHSCRTRIKIAQMNKQVGFSLHCLMFNSKITMQHARLTIIHHYNTILFVNCNNENDKNKYKLNTSLRIFLLILGRHLSSVLTQTYLKIKQKTSTECSTLQ